MLCVPNGNHFFGVVKPGFRGGRFCECGELYAVPVWTNRVPRDHVGWNVTDPPKPLAGEETA